MGWSLNYGEETLVSIKEFPESIKVQDTDTGIPISISRIKAWEGERNLGV